MTLHDFTENYYLHDSLLDKIVYSESEHTLVLYVDFAFWMQKNYQENEPEVGPIEIRFSGVEKYRGPSAIPYNQCAILDCFYEDGGIRLNFVNEITEEYYESFILSKDVAVIL